LTAQFIYYQQLIFDFQGFQYYFIYEDYKSSEAQMNRLRLARFEKRITQLQLFKKTGIWPSRISAIENGLLEARRDEKKKLAKTLVVAETWLFPENKNEKPYSGPEQQDRR
jgi:transcriptional regulator with XRE-family HTH domain